MSDVMIPCAECGWFGERSDLVVADGIEHCPKCGREHKLEPVYMSMGMAKVEKRVNDDGTIIWTVPPGCD